MKHLLTTISFLLHFFAVSCACFSQTSLTSPNKHFLFKNYTTHNGLIDNQIWALAQDKNGYLWIGSDLGLARFDGKTFYHKVKPEINIYLAPFLNLVKTADENIIFTTWGHGVFVQQRNGQFKQYVAGQNYWGALKYCRDGKVYVAQTDALYLLTQDSLQQLYDHGTRGLFNSIEVDRENRIWFGSNILGLGMLQRKGTAYKPVFLPEFKDKTIFRILFDEEGTLHVPTSQGYYRIKWNSSSYWNNYTIEQPFPQLRDLDINSIYLDHAQNLWISTTSYGVFRSKGDSITLHLTKENGLLSSNVKCVLQDREGNYWFGTNRGLSMVDNFDNCAITHNGTLFIDARGMILDEYNRIWFSGSNRLHIFLGDQLIPLNVSGTPIEKEGARFVNIFNSELIIANNAGLYKMPLTNALPDLRKLRKIADFKTHNITSLNTVTADSAGIWITSLKKIYNYRNGRLLPVTFKYSDTISLKSGLTISKRDGFFWHSDSITVIPLFMIPDKYGYYWYGDNRSGLYRGVLSRPDNHTLLFECRKYYRPDKTDADFETEFIDYLCFDKEDNLWFTSSLTGVYKLRIDAKDVISYKLYSHTDGLSNTVVKQIYFDAQGRVWFSTREAGIYVLQCDSAGVESVQKWNIEGVGGRFRRVLQIGNSLFILTDEGVFYTSNPQFETRQSVPKIFISNLLINGIEHSDLLKKRNVIHLIREQNNITIEFSAITFKNANDVKYQYKLEGANEDWSTLSERSFVEYASLQPGKYIFQVRAVIGEVTGEEDELFFRIAPAFHQTVWFYLLIACGLFVLIFSFYQYSLNNAIKIERIRSGIASDLHDEIGSTLSSISLLSEMASRRDKESPLAKSLSVIGENSRDVLSSMDDIIWSVNPQNDSLTNLVVRLREYAIPVCEAKNITLNMNVEESIYDVKLEMEARKNIYLIVKEAINNAVKYSGCKNLTVTFVNKHQLEIAIKDDGCGFDTTAPTSRNGLINMERRAKQMGADFSIKSKKNAGTSIFLKTKNHIII